MSVSSENPQTPAGRLIILPSPADVHPMRCAATLPPGAGYHIADHEHACIHPARDSIRQTDGIPEHTCHCGVVWTERGVALPAGEPEDDRDAERPLIDQTWARDWDSPEDAAYDASGPSSPPAQPSTPEVGGSGHPRGTGSRQEDREASTLQPRKDRP